MMLFTHRDLGYPKVKETKYKGYFVSRCGRVFKGLRELKPSDNGKGYLTVSINRKMTRVHRIVAETFIENENLKPQVNHINGVKTDNRVVNLEWCTAQENVDHAFETGLAKGRPKKFKADMVQLIVKWNGYRERYNRVTQKEFRLFFDTSHVTMRNILRGVYQEEN